MRGAEFDAEFAREFLQRDRHGARAAHRIPDAFVVLHVGDAAQHGGRAVGRRADVLREVIHHLRDARVRIERAHRARDAAAHAHGEHVAEQLRVEGGFEVKHVAQSADGFVEEVALRDVVEPLAQRDEIAVAPAGIRAGREPIEGLRHRRPGLDSN